MRQQAGRPQPPTAGWVDSHSVKTTELGGERGDEKGKNVPGRQRPLVGDTLGLVMAVTITAASVSAPAGARLLFARLGGAWKKLRWLWGKGGYRGPRGDGVSHPLRFIRRVPSRPEGGKGVVLRPRRWVGEGPLAWRKQSRRLRTDYARLPQSSEAMIDLSMTRRMLRRLTAT